MRGQGKTGAKKRGGLNEGKRCTDGRRMWEESKTRMNKKGRQVRREGGMKEERNGGISEENRRMD